MQLVNYFSCQIWSVYATYHEGNAWKNEAIGKWFGELIAAIFVVHMFSTLKAMIDWFGATTFGLANTFPMLKVLQGT